MTDGARHAMNGEENRESCARCGSDAAAAGLAGYRPCGRCPSGRAADFIGLWTGVDRDDGSHTQRSITCQEDGTCLVLGSDQFFSFCPEDEGRGILERTGTIEAGAGVLTLPLFTLTCANGEAVGFPTIFSLDRSNGTLIEDTDGPPATITFHRCATGSRRITPPAASPGASSPRAR